MRFVLVRGYLHEQPACLYARRAASTNVLVADRARRCAMSRPIDEPDH